MTRSAATRFVAAMMGRGVRFGPQTPFRLDADQVLVERDATVEVVRVG